MATERVNRPSRGLLQFLRVDSQGIGPDVLNLSVQPTLDMEGFAGAGILRVAYQETTITAGSENGSVQLQIGVPSSAGPQLGMVALACGCNTGSLLATGDTVQPRVTLQATPQADFGGTIRTNVQLAMGQPTMYAGAGAGGFAEANVSYTFPRPVLLTPSQILIGAIQNCVLTNDILLRVWVWGYQVALI